MWGNLAYFRQKREGYDEHIEGWAERMEYDGRADKLQMFNRACSSADRTKCEVSYISYDSNSEFFQVTAAAKSASAKPGDNRVRVILQPKPKDAPSPAPGVPLRPDGERQTRRAGCRQELGSALRDTVQGAPLELVPDAVADVHRAARRQSQEALSFARRRERRLPGSAQRRGDRAARPERRGQDHVLLHDGRPRPDGRRRAVSSTASALTHMPIHARARRGLSYLPQEASIFRRLSVADNVRAVLELHERGREHRSS